LRSSCSFAIECHSPKETSIGGVRRWEINLSLRTLGRRDPIPHLFQLKWRVENNRHHHT
jgi:hypothetical protein